LTDLRFKTFGNTKDKISSIGLGTGTGFGYIDKKTDQQLVYVLQKALDLGVNFFDTAEVYFDGHSEKIIGKAFKKRREKAFIATKFLPENSGYKELLKAADESLKRLQVDYIDLYQIHWSNPIVPVRETLKALERLVKKGKIKYLGVCNFSIRQLKEIRKFSKIPIASLQSEYNLLERSAELDLIPFCEKNKMSFIAYTPLNSGNILKKEKNIKMFSNLSGKYGKTATQIILNYLIQHPNVIAIPATTNIVHLMENIKANDFTLEKQDLKILKKIFTPKLIYIDTGKIKVAYTRDHAVYKTLKEALENKLNFFPSPEMLSDDIKKGDFLKAVKVRKLKKIDGIFEYELLGGRIRYWAWVIAHRTSKPIPAIVEE